jgi:hypothetical protein
MYAFLAAYESVRKPGFTGYAPMGLSEYGFHPLDVDENQ